MSRVLFELAHVESPFVWRAKFALAHKGLDYESHRAGFTELPGLFRDGHRTVPVLQESNGDEIQGSGPIAEHLDQAYPDTPTLLSPDQSARAKGVEALLNQHAFRAYFPLYILDIHAALPEAEAAYFRTSREARVGMPLEQFGADREARLPAAREALQPLRDALEGQPWFHGAQPGYGDYVVLAFFVWILSVATRPPLAEDDALVPWIERGFSLHGGIARNFL